MQYRKIAGRRKMVWELPLLIFALMAALLDSVGEAELVSRLKAHEPDAMAEFYDRYGRLVNSVILRIVRNASTAEDLTQEVFLRVWNRIHLLDAQQGTLGAWLLAIARNRAIDYVRSLDARFAQNSFELDQRDHPSQFCNIERDLLNQDHSRRIKAALSKLTANQQQVIELAYFEGLSQSEMADRLQQPLGTVKTWVRTALKTLRDELGSAAIA